MRFRWPAWRTGWLIPIVAIGATVVVASAATLGGLQSANITNASIPDGRCTTDEIKVQPLRNLASAVDDYGQVRLIDVPAPCVGGSVQVTAYDASGNALGDGTGTAVSGITSIDLDDFDRSLYAGAALTINGWGLNTERYQLLVAVGVNRMIQYSLDQGVTWNAATVGGANNQPINDVATDGAGNWVAVGNNNNNNNNRVWFSTDGLNWTTPAGPGNRPTSNLNSIATNGMGLWVAFGAGGNAFSATYNGTNPVPTWTAVTVGSGQMRQVAVNAAGRWAVVANNNPRSWWSNNGLGWTATVSTIGQAVLGLAADSGGDWVAVGNGANNNNRVWYSTDGQTWTVQAAGAGLRPTVNLLSVATNGAGRWVATGGSGNVWYRDEGGSPPWVIGTITATGNLNDVAHDDAGHWSLVGDNGTWRSTNGTSWTTGTVLPQDTLGVAFDQLLPN